MTLLLNIVFIQFMNTWVKLDISYPHIHQSIYKKSIYISHFPELS